MEARIVSARKCREAGYSVRIRLSPMAPVVGWRDEIRHMLRRLFESSGGLQAALSEGRRELAALDAIEAASAAADAHSRAGVTGQVAEQGK